MFVFDLALVYEDGIEQGNRRGVEVVPDYRLVFQALGQCHEHRAATAAGVKDFPAWRQLGDNIFRDFALASLVWQSYRHFLSLSIILVRKEKVAQNLAFSR